MMQTISSAARSRLQSAVARPVRHLIFRAHPAPLRPESYNVQEIGLADFLRTAGVSVEIAAAGISAAPRVSAWPVRSLEFRRLHPAVAWVRNLSAIDFSAFDIIQLSDLHLPANLQVLARAPRGSRFLVYQGYYPESYGRGRWLRRAQLRVAAQILRRHRFAVLAKNSAAARLLEQHGLGHVPVAGVGLNASGLLAPEPLPWEVEWFLKRPGCTFLYVGTLDERRPLEWVLPHLRWPRLAPARLLIVGDGPAVPRLREQFRDLIATDRVLFVERLRQPQLGAVYPWIDCLVLPTRHEILGMVGLEALLFRRPIVASAEPGPSDLAVRFPGSITLIEAGENSAGWRTAMLAHAATPSPRGRIVPDDARVRELSWAEPGRRFLAAMKDLMETRGRAEPETRL